MSSSILVLALVRVAGGEAASNSENTKYQRQKTTQKYWNIKYISMSSSIPILAPEDSPAGLRGGQPQTPAWGTELENRAGGQSWRTELEDRAGGQSWMTELEDRAGGQSWRTELEDSLSYGWEDWGTWHTWDWQVSGSEPDWYLRLETEVMLVLILRT